MRRRMSPGEERMTGRIDERPRKFVLASFLRALQAAIFGDKLVYLRGQCPVLYGVVR